MRTAGIVVAGFLLASAGGANAACFRTPPRVGITPWANMVAPRNTVVRVSWTPETISAPSSVPAIQLRTVGKHATTVATTATVISEGTTTVVILKPDAPLAAKTSYEVVDASDAKKPRSLGEAFRTSNIIDETAPTWSGTIASTGRRAAAQSDHVDRPHGGCGGEPGPGILVVLHDLPALKDDASPNNGLVFGIWRGDKQSFDPKTPPALILSPAPTLIINAFELAFTDAPFAMVIAPIDLAGNVGAAAFVVAPPKGQGGKP